MNIYISNLGSQVTSESLNAIFSAHGTVSSCRVIRDHETGQSRGFGFIEMSDNEEAATAISRINGSILDGLQVIVKTARPRPEPRPGLVERLRGY